MRNAIEQTERETLGLDDIVAIASELGISKSAVERACAGDTCVGRDDSLNVVAAGHAVVARQAQKPIKEMLMISSNDAVYATITITIIAVTMVIYFSAVAQIAQLMIR